MDRVAIEDEARRTLIEVWMQREVRFPSGIHPLGICDPRCVSEYHGLSYELRESMLPEQQGQFEAAGLLDRRRMILAVSSAFSYDVQRFTGAHEVGHFVLHGWIGDKVLHRDRPLHAPQSCRPPVEQEADYFAACMLMPRRMVFEEFDLRFGSRHPLALTEDVAFHLGVRDPGPLFAAPRGSLLFPSAVARAQSFDRKRFPSMAQTFGVSTTAMAIRLEELGLVAAYLTASSF